MLRAPPTKEPTDMAETREELREMLKGLEADMPWLMKAYPDPEDFVEVFADQADLITDTLVDTDNNAWVLAEINLILGKSGHVDGRSVSS